MDQQWEEDLYLFTALALSDTVLVSPSDLLYLFSETNDNRASVLEAARDIYRRGGVWGNNTAIPDNDTNPGYSGFAEWYKALYEHYTVPRIVSVFPITVPGNLNTLSEAKAMIRYAHENAMKTIIVVAPAFHMPRAFLSAISVVVRECPDVSVYALAGSTPDWWFDSVGHSQGHLRNTRAELFRGAERERIAKYQREGDYYPGGDLVSFPLAFEYLHVRDKRQRAL